MIRDAEIMKSEKLEPLMEEANELIAITVSSINTARGGKR